MAMERNAAQLQLRQASGDDAEAITALTMLSKAWWGYDDAFMRDAAAALRFRWERFPEGWVWVLSDGEGLAGFCSLTGVDAGTVELHDLFIHPAWIGNGCGLRLWLHATEHARAQGFRHLVLNADPNAEGFYVKSGATRIGEVASDIRPGRMLPLLHFALSDDTTGTPFAAPQASAC